MIAGLSCCAIDLNWKNTLFNIELAKISEGKAKVILHMEKKFDEPLCILSKGNNEYVLLLPETKNAVSSKSIKDNFSNKIEFITVKDYPYINNSNNGYTKIVLKTKSALSFVPEARLKSPVMIAATPVVAGKSGSAAKGEASKAQQKPAASPVQKSSGAGIKSQAGSSGSVASVKASQTAAPAKVSGSKAVKTVKPTTAASSAISPKKAAPATTTATSGAISPQKPVAAVTTATSTAVKKPVTAAVCTPAAVQTKVSTPVASTVPTESKTTLKPETVVPETVPQTGATTSAQNDEILASAVNVPERVVPLRVGQELKRPKSSKLSINDLFKNVFGPDIKIVHVLIALILPIIILALLLKIFKKQENVESRTFVPIRPESKHSDFLHGLAADEIEPENVGLQSEKPDEKYYTGRFDRSNGQSSAFDDYQENFNWQERVMSIQQGVSSEINEEDSSGYVTEPESPVVVDDGIAARAEALEKIGEVNGFVESVKPPEKSVEQVKTSEKFIEQAKMPQKSVDLQSFRNENIQKIDDYFKSEDFDSVSDDTFESSEVSFKEPTLEPVQETVAVANLNEPLVELSKPVTDDAAQKFTAEKVVESAVKQTNVENAEKTLVRAEEQSETVSEELSADILASLELSNSAGLYLVKYGNSYAFIGYIKDEMFVLKNFEQVKNPEIQARFVEEKNRVKSYMVRVNDQKMLIDVEKNLIKCALEM